MTQRVTIREITRIAIFTALTCVLSQIIIPLPFTPIPITLGILAVYITGVLLPPRSALFSILAYLALGGVGAPVFQGFNGGPGALFGPTGGYLLAYPILALSVSLALAWYEKKALSAENFSLKRASLAVILSGLASLAVLYLFGSAWLAVLRRLTFWEAFLMAGLPFIPLDVVKVVFCGFCIVPVRRRLGAAYRPSQP